MRCTEECACAHADELRCVRFEVSTGPCALRARGRTEQIATYLGFYLVCTAHMRTNRNGRAIAFAEESVPHAHADEPKWLCV